jgi:hypothetical protein
MLTKQERAAIAERIKSVDYVDEKTFYESIVGKCVPSTTSYTEDLKTMFRVVLDLCDSSNMIELPLDKNGVPFKIGDTVYDPNNKQRKVNGYVFVNGCWKIIVSFWSESDFTSIYSNDLTHKKPVTIASLAKELTDIVGSDYGTPMVVKRKISDIADQLESLGDSDD